MALSESDYQTSVPSPNLTDAGFFAPSEQDILAGVQQDINAALGGAANMALNTPQGQLAISETAILSDSLAQTLLLMNGIDPARASGRMQDAIGRIYFVTRRPATPTVVEVEITATGNNAFQVQAGTSIAWDTQGNVYALTSTLSVPANMPTVTAQVQNIVAGAIPCGANTLSLYQGGLGIASLTNPQPGTTGENVEGRKEFEQRRQASVAMNSKSTNAAMTGALQSLPNVIDALAVDNDKDEPQTISGVTIPPHSIYAVVAGGTPFDIGKAILSKKAPGCNTFGDQKVTVIDSDPVYAASVQPTYTFSYQQAKPTAIAVSVSLQNGASVPADAVAQVQQAIISTLTVGQYRARIDGTIYAANLICAIAGIGDWAKPIALTLSVGGGAGQNSLTLPIDQIAEIDASNISVILQD